MLVLWTCSNATEIHKIELKVKLLQLDPQDSLVLGTKSLLRMKHIYLMCLYILSLSRCSGSEKPRVQLLVVLSLGGKQWWAVGDLQTSSGLSHCWEHWGTSSSAQLCLELETPIQWAAKSNKNLPPYLNLKDSCGQKSVVFWLRRKTSYFVWQSLTMHYHE